MFELLIFLLSRGMTLVVNKLSRSPSDCVLNCPNCKQVRMAKRDMDQSSRMWLFCQTCGQRFDGDAYHPDSTGVYEHESILSRRRDARPKS